MNHPLINMVAEEMLTRLELVALKPKRILAVQEGDLRKRYQDAVIVTEATEVVDLIFSNLLWKADLEGQVKEWRQWLRPEGLLMFATFGPNTFLEIENQTYSFMDMHNIGDVLVKNGFSDPVIDVEHVEIKYQHANQVLQDLAMLGFEKITQAPLSLTFEIVYGHAWSPDKTVDSEGVVNIPLSVLRKQLQK